MQDDQNTQNSNLQNQSTPVSVPTVGKEGAAVKLDPIENSGVSIETAPIQETTPKNESQIEKIEKNTTSNLAQNQNPVPVNTPVSTNNTNLANNSKLNLPISLSDAIKLTHGFSLFNDSSDPLLWLSFLVIKNYDQINKK